MAVSLSTLRIGRALLPEKYSDTHFCYRLIEPQKRLGKLKGKIQWHRDTNPYPPLCSTAHRQFLESLLKDRKLIHYAIRSVQDTPAW
jgi:hypothetical protein